MLVVDIARRALDRLEPEGLPVTFMRYVCRHYDWSIHSGDSYVNPWTNNLWLNNYVVVNLQKIVERIDIYVPNPIEALYHEGTHAYIDLRREDSTNDLLGSLFRRARNYYSSAPMRDGSTGDDANRLAHEALAMFVGSNAGGYYSALSSLYRAREDIINRFYNNAHYITDREANILREQLDDIRQTYNDAGSRRVFGYEPQGIMGRQTYTTLPIPAYLSQFGRDDLLEGKIPTNFDRATNLKNIFDGILTEIDRQLRARGRLRR